MDFSIRASAMNKGVEQRFPQLEVVRHLRKDSAATVAGLVVAGIALAAVLAPILAPYPYDTQDLSQTLAHPTSNHLLGTDQYGRDLLSRLIFGARVSMTVAISAVVLETVLGIAIGAFSAYYRGWVDMVFMRIADVLFAFPHLLFAVLLAGILGPGLVNVVIALSLVGWPAMARTVRGEILWIKEREFVDAARALGADDRRIILRHLIPNTVHLVVVRTTLGVGVVIMAEATLSFLGVGVPSPMPSWGLMISESFKYLRSYPELTLFPGIALSVTVLAFNFFGEGLADAMDPHRRAR